jgi:hypothetical protein
MEPLNGRFRLLYRIVHIPFISANCVIKLKDKKVKADD